MDRKPWGKNIFSSIDISEEKQLYRRWFRKTIVDQGVDNIVYINASGFEHRVNSAYGYAKPGQQLCGEVRWNIPFSKPFSKPSGAISHISVDIS